MTELKAFIKNAFIKNAFIKKASFSVEAAYIVPLMLVFIASLLGFTYFIHQVNWSKGAAYESLYYGMQKSTQKTDPEETAAERLADRVSERTLDISEIDARVESGAAEIKAVMKTTVLPEVFGPDFVMEQDSSALKTDPTAVKKAEWIIKYTAELFGN